MKTPKGMGGQIPKPVDMIGEMSGLMAEMMEDPLTQSFDIPDDRSKTLMSNGNSSLDISKWVTLWPNNIDGGKSIAMGRKISKEEAVSPPPPLPEGSDVPLTPQFTGPTVEDITNGLHFLKLRYAVQPYKMYPRDASSHWQNPGRFKVELFNERNGNPINKEMADRTSLFKAVALAINRAGNRRTRLENERRKLEVRDKELRIKMAEAEKAEAAAVGAKALAAAGQSGAQGNRKKKGKKK
jgi:signal recognition particle subunit SEC65